MNDEKIFRRVLVCTVCPLYLFIAFLAFIIIGVDNVYADTGADTMVCNYKGVDYFDTALGSNTYCTNLFTNGDSAVWDGVLGINFITSRINYNLDKNYNYTFYVSQYVSWFDYATDGIAWLNPLSHKITLPNNSNAYTGSAEFLQLQSYTCSAKYCIRIDYKVNINVNESVSYFDLDTTFKGLYFTGYGDKHIRVASVYSMEEPNYDVQNGINNIINNNNNNTNNIINNNQDNTNNIINNNNQNTQDIINNNQQNTENIINGINDNFTTCTEDDLTTNTIKNQKMVIDSTGSVITAPSNPKRWYVLSNISIDDYQEITISGVNSSSEYYMIIQDKYKSILKISKVQNSTIKIEDNYSYLAISINSSDNISIIGKKCFNRMDETNNKLDETNDYLKDDTPPDADISSLGNVTGLLPPGPLDTLLNIPFTFLSILTSSFGGVCRDLSGTFVFDSTLTIPCFSTIFYDKVPSFLMIFLDIIPTAFMLIKYFKHLYKKIERATSMETNSDDEWGVI